MARGAGHADGRDPRAARVRPGRARRSPCGRSCSAIAIFAGLLWLVATRRDAPARDCGSRRVLVVLWANMHGSFVLAPLVLGYAWLDDVARGRPSRTSLAVLRASASLATLVNPFGPARVGVRRGDRRQPGDHRARQRVAADDAAHRARGAVLRVRDRRPARDGPRARPPCAGPTGCGSPACSRSACGPCAASPGGRSRRRSSSRPRCRSCSRLARRRPPRGRPGRARSPRSSRSCSALAIVVALPWWRPADPLTGRVGLLTYAPSGLAQAVRDAAKPGDRVFRPRPGRRGSSGRRPTPRYFLDSRFELFPAAVWDDYDAIAAAAPSAGGPRPVGRQRDRACPPAPTPPPGGWTTVYDDADGVAPRSRDAVTTPPRWYLRTTREARSPLLWSPDR